MNAITRPKQARALKSPEDSHSVLASGTLHGPDGPERVIWQVPEEIPVALQFNSQNYAVMMATPADLEDLAVGFALSEGILKGAGDVEGVLVLPAEQGLAVDLAIPASKLNRDRMAKRSIEGRTGCGLCGIEDIRDVIRMPGRDVASLHVSPEAIARAFEQLPTFQPMNAVNRTVHAAAWCSPEGRILVSREDVGRHNALDKLIGALARAGTDVGSGFVLMSSRCSFELVQKCAIAGIGVLATVSAPTALALSLARQAHLKLAALSQRGVMIFDQE